MNLALISGGDKKIALAVEGHRPNVFLMRIEENLVLAVRPDLVHFPVWIRGGVDLVARIHRQGVNFQAVELGEGAALSGSVDREQLRRSAAGAAARGVQIALGIGRDGPQVRGR